jgi:UDP-N-acetylglucosamine 2-epimerase (non-hydrolysing)
MRHTGISTTLSNEGSKSPALHFFIGTKAQLIKMAPIMQELDRRGIAYRFINAGQHAATLRDLIEQFGLRQPDVNLRRGSDNITRFWQGIKWLGGLLMQAVFRPAHVRDVVFGGRGGLCLIHGDTATTLVSAIMAKRAGLGVAHVEAGLRSYNIFDPFPEELIRLIAMRLADLLLAPDEWAMTNLKAMRVPGEVVWSGGNTVRDTLDFALARPMPAGGPAAGSDYAVMSIHRFETIQSRARLSRVIDLARRIGAERPVKFVTHGPTLNTLRRFGLLRDLEAAPGVELLPLQDYLTFVAMLNRAAFIVVDGGSIQEESAILGVPCLILRKRTERRDGLGENALLAGFDHAKIGAFLAGFERFRRPSARRQGTESPAARIADECLRWLGQNGPG